MSTTFCEGWFGKRETRNGKREAIPSGFSSAGRPDLVPRKPRNFWPGTINGRPSSCSPLGGRSSGSKKRLPRPVCRPNGRPFTQASRFEAPSRRTFLDSARVLSLFRIPRMRSWHVTQEFRPVPWCTTPAPHQVEKPWSSRPPGRGCWLVTLTTSAWVDWRTRPGGREWRFTPLLPILRRRRCDPAAWMPFWSTHRVAPPGRFDDIPTRAGDCARGYSNAWLSGRRVC